MIKLNYKRAVLLHTLVMFVILAAVFSAIFTIQERRSYEFLMRSVDKQLDEIVYVVTRDIERSEGYAGLDYLDRQVIAQDTLDFLSIVHDNMLVCSTDRSNRVNSGYYPAESEYVLKKKFKVYYNGTLSDYFLFAGLNENTLNSFKGNSLTETIKYSFAVSCFLLILQLLSLYIIYKTTFRRFYNNMLKKEFGHRYFLEEIDIMNSVFGGMYEDLKSTNSALKAELDENQRQDRLQNLQIRVSECFLASDEAVIFDGVNRALREYFSSEFGYFGYISAAGELVCPSMSLEIFAKCAIDSKSNVFPRETWGGLWGESLITKKTLYKNFDMKVPEGHIHLRNALVVPILSFGEVIGQYAMANRQDEFTEDDIVSAELIAVIIAPVLKHWYRTKYHEENLVSEKKRLEDVVQQELAIKHRQEQILFEQKKFADMGQMMSAIAHQWRQPLNALAIIIQNLGESYSEDEVNEEYIEDFEQNGIKLIMHMSETIDHFRNFFVPDKDRVKFEAISETISLLKLINVQLTSRNIILELTCICDKKVVACTNINNFPPCEFGRTKIFGYPGEFKQSVINIVYNAVDAIKSAKESDRSFRGKVTINFLSQGDELKITISDNGGGIDPAVMDKIFDPYFSTKEQGKGTGIGLYMARMIIENHMEGRLTAENGADGAVFTIRLPLAL